MSYRIKRQCDSHNLASRRVTSHTSFPVSRILRSAGDLLITGGSRGQRQTLLLQAVCRFREQFPDRAAVVFTDSPELEHGLIAAVSGGAPGPLMVSSSVYPNYDVLYGLPPAQLASCIGQMAQVVHCAAPGVTDYALAFLNILDRLSNGGASLKTMRDFARNSDPAIAAWARDEGMETEAMQIMASAESGKAFRSLLEIISAAFASLLPPDGHETGFNLSLSTDSPCTVCIRASTAGTEIVSAYFAQILLALAGTGRAFALFLDGPLLLRQPAFLQALEALKGSVPVTVSTEDAGAVQAEQFLFRFSRDIILLGGEFAGVQKALASLGEYTHFEPAQSISAPARLFGLSHRSVSDSILTYSRPKVLPEETRGFQAVLRGDHGPDIRLVHRLEVLQ